MYSTGSILGCSMWHNMGTEPVCLYCLQIPEITTNGRACTLVYSDQDTLCKLSV